MWEMPPGPELGGGGLLVGRWEGWSAQLPAWVSCSGWLPFLNEPCLVIASGREKRQLLVGSPHTSPNKTPGPTPCPLLVESASAGASHRGFKTCYFLVFFRFQNSPACPIWDSTTFLTGLPLPLASKSVICKLDWVLKLPRELFIFILLPSLYTILYCLCRVGWLGFYDNT